MLPVQQVDLVKRLVLVHCPCYLPNGYQWYMERLGGGPYLRYVPASTFQAESCRILIGSPAAVAIDIAIVLV